MELVQTFGSNNVELRRPEQHPDGYSFHTDADLPRTVVATLSHEELQDVVDQAAEMGIRARVAQVITRETNPWTPSAVEPLSPEVAAAIANVEQPAAEQPEQPAASAEAEPPAAPAEQPSEQPQDVPEWPQGESSEAPEQPVSDPLPVGDPPVV